MNGWLAKKCDKWLIQIAIVCKAHALSMQSMLYLGGSGGMPPKKIFANLTFSVLNLVIFLTHFLKVIHKQAL